MGKLPNLSESSFPHHTILCKDLLKLLPGLQEKWPTKHSARAGLTERAPHSLAIINVSRGLYFKDK